MIAKSCFALALAALISASAAAEPPKPLLWKVSDGDNEVYLLGSVHMLSERDYPLAGSTDTAFADAEHLRFEIPPGATETPEGIAVMRRVGLLPPDQKLQDQIGAETFALVERWAASRQQAIETFQRMQPWMVALFVSIDTIRSLGFKPELGVDRHFMARAASAAKPVQGLETVEDQLATFSLLTPAQQEETLREALDSDGKAGDRVQRLYALWRAGDAEGLFAMQHEDLGRYPEFYRAINHDRNRAWLPKIESLLQASGEDQDAMVIVGSLHLLGSDGLVEMLRAKGYQVTRL